MLDLLLKSSLGFKSSLSSLLGSFECLLGLSGFVLGGLHFSLSLGEFLESLRSQKLILGLKLRHGFLVRLLLKSSLLLFFGFLLGLEGSLSGFSFSLESKFLFLCLLSGFLSSSFRGHLLGKLSRLLLFFFLLLLLSCFLLGGHFSLECSLLLLKGLSEGLFELSLSLLLLSGQFSGVGCSFLEFFFLKLGFCFGIGFLASFLLETVGFGVGGFFSNSISLCLGSLLSHNSIMLSLLSGQRSSDLSLNSRSLSLLGLLSQFSLFLNGFSLLSGLGLSGCFLESLFVFNLLCSFFLSVSLGLLCSFLLCLGSSFFHGLEFLFKSFLFDFVFLLECLFLCLLGSLGLLEFSLNSGVLGVFGGLSSFGLGFSLSLSFSGSLFGSDTSPVVDGVLDEVLINFLFVIAVAFFILSWEWVDTLEAGWITENVVSLVCFDGSQWLRSHIFEVSKLLRVATLELCTVDHVTVLARALASVSGTVIWLILSERLAPALLWQFFELSKLVFHMFAHAHVRFSADNWISNSLSLFGGELELMQSLECLNFVTIIWSDSQTVVNSTIASAGIVFITALVWFLFRIVWSDRQLWSLHGTVFVPVLFSELNGSFAIPAKLVSDFPVFVEVSCSHHPGHESTTLSHSSLLLTLFQVVLNWSHLTEITVSIRVTLLLFWSHHIWQ